MINARYETSVAELQRRLREGVERWLLSRGRRVTRKSVIKLDDGVGGRWAVIMGEPGKVPFAVRVRSKAEARHTARRFKHARVRRWKADMR